MRTDATQHNNATQQRTATFPYRLQEVGRDILFLSRKSVTFCLNATYSGKDRRVSVMKISDFQTKDVINIIDGKKLGQITDIELDLRNGRIESIVVPIGGKFFGFFGGVTDLVIPWRSIVKIGADVILVKMDDLKAYRGDERLRDGTRAYSERDRERPKERERGREEERYRDEYEDDDYR